IWPRTSNLPRGTIFAGFDDSFRDGSEDMLLPQGRLIIRRDATNDHTTGIVCCEPLECLELAPRVHDIHDEIADRYIRTVSTMPNSSASAISAWPIDTSSINGIAAKKVGRFSRFKSWPALTPSPTSRATRAAPAYFSSTAR